MNLETFKTFLLTILVGLSLLLTFGLWNYQPNYDPLYNLESKYINEVDIGGIEESKKTIINPSSIIFHGDESHLGFASPKDQQILYRKMQDWVLDDFKKIRADGRPESQNQVEVIFPVEIPMEMIKGLFTIQKEDPLPNWSFQRMFIQLNQANSTLNVYFLALDGREQVSFTVNDSSVYAYVWSYISTQKGLNEYISFGPDNSPIYLPANQVEILRKSVAFEGIDSTLLVNALFKNPSLVSRNIGEAYFTDGQRGMQILQDGRSMEFINPIQLSNGYMDKIDLLDISLSNINGHKGWTNEYSLVGFERAINQIHFRMHFDGYPVFNNSGLSMIEQQWRNRELHQYRRPLFRLNNMLGEDMVTLPSGPVVTSYVMNNDLYDEEGIIDIQIGYKLSYSESASYSLTLEPAWYMNYNGNWQEIRMDDLDAYEKGGG